MISRRDAFKATAALAAPFVLREALGAQLSPRQSRDPPPAVGAGNLRQPAWRQHCRTPRSRRFHLGPGFEYRHARW